MGRFLQNFKKQSVTKNKKLGNKISQNYNELNYNEAIQKYMPTFYLPNRQLRKVKLWEKPITPLIVL